MAESPDAMLVQEKKLLNGAPATLRILHLEDDQADRDLVRHILSGSTMACDIAWVKNREEFIRALSNEKFDLILSDYSLPGYDGKAALAFARKSCPETPWVFVSGTLGEEQAIESLKGGATDYVLKDRLERLVPAVERALREADEHHKRCAAEDALRKAEARFRDIFENAVEGIYQANLQGQFLDANRSMARICGYASAAEFCAEARDLYVDQVKYAEFLRLLIAQGEVLGREFKIRRKDGADIWISQSARLVRGLDNEVLYFEAMVTDITERKATEEALHQSEQRFREMAERIGEVFYVVAPDTGRLLYVSPSYEQIWGRSLTKLESQAEQWLEAVDPANRNAFNKARAELAAGKESTVEYCINRPDKEQRWIEDRTYLIKEADGTVSRAVGVAIDITRRRQLERQLVQAQKMEAVGQLAGGVAHDFNNVLTVVIGYARLLLDRPSMPPDVTEGLTQIFTAGNRAANLTRQLLVFSRKQPIERRGIDLGVVAGDISNMLRYVIGEHIKLEFVPSVKPCAVEADAGMLEQVLMNLAVNARDAMSGGGMLTITVESLVITDASTRPNPDARTGEFVCLSVRDTGCGIPAENLQRIFEPFFTTKEVGRGTGLGLSMVFGIVQQHQGWIEIESAVGKGTCFRIMVPAAQAAAIVTKRLTGRNLTVAGGSETVLLVEDEPSVREFAAAVLRGHGYRVLQASTGTDALEVWKWHGTRISLLVSDVVLTDGIGGLELVDRLRREKPALKVVLMSGYAHEAGGVEFRVPAGVHYIQKPCKPQALAQVVRNALDDKYDR